jgi:hypothetical protein
MASRSGGNEPPRTSRRGPVFVCAWLASLSLPAHGSFLHGETLDAVASWLALIVIFIVPIVGIAAFWMVHVLPEKIAHKRHHPQTEAIQVLCLLSLVFGGLLWPLAWLWAFSKPVFHQLAYGTDKHEDFYANGTETERLRGDVAELRGNVERVLANGGTQEELAAIRDRLAALEPQLVARTRSVAKEVH